MQDTNIHILKKYVTFRKIVIGMFKKTQNYPKKPPKNQTESDNDCIGNQRIQTSFFSGQLSPKHFLRILRGLIFQFRDHNTKCMSLQHIYIDSHDYVTHFPVSVMGHNNIEINKAIKPLAGIERMFRNNCFIKVCATLSNTASKNMNMKILLCE